MVFGFNGFVVNKFCDSKIKSEINFNLADTILLNIRKTK